MKAMGKKRMETGRLTETEKQKKAEALAGELFRLARDSIFVHLRFLDVALSGIKKFCDISIIYSFQN